jgi:hypothetical protein
VVSIGSGWSRVWFVSRFFTSSRLRCLLRCNSGLGLPFHLVVEMVKTNGRKQMYKYTPHPDFHVTIGNFPHILLEVNSQSNEGDENRMLLQAACISRIGNWLRASTNHKPIVIMAIYIDKTLKVRQHLVCQPDVHSLEVVFNWF